MQISQTVPENGCERQPPKHYDKCVKTALHKACSPWMNKSKNVHPLGIFLVLTLEDGLVSFTSKHVR